MRLPTINVTALPWLKHPLLFYYDKSFGTEQECPCNGEMTILVRWPYVYLCIIMIMIFISVLVPYILCHGHFMTYKRYIKQILTISVEIWTQTMSIDTISFFSVSCFESIGGTFSCSEKVARRLAAPPRRHNNGRTFTVFLRRWTALIVAVTGWCYVGKAPTTLPASTGRHSDKTWGKVGGMQNTFGTNK